MDEQEHEFFDELYRQWSHTTGAEKTYWMPEESRPERFDIYAFDPETQNKSVVAKWLSEADADFICGLHGAVPDLIRRLHDLVDEAARKDEANDIAQGQLAEALLEIQGLKEEIYRLERSA